MCIGECGSRSGHVHLHKTKRKEEEDVVTRDKRYLPRMNPPGILNVYHLGAEKRLNEVSDTFQMKQVAFGNTHCQQDLSFSIFIMGAEQNGGFLPPFCKPFPVSYSQH